MTIVFDEVTGSVEPHDAPHPKEPAELDAPTAPDEARLEQWLRRQIWLEARRLAD